MTTYQVLARRYRPQTFLEVYGQEAVVTTLKNAIAHKRLAHAYLFCGSRGTGKTTLARVFAKALNCQAPDENLEPCNQCSSCREITGGSSLNVLEIDGASNRGIDDVRQITETVGYAAAAGGYKIYIIDEVHMLTKEAFNALLKTLEEPPPRVLFFFATTEPHKVPPTILSRCQRFNLQRISIDKIVQKLSFIAKEQQVQITEEAIYVIAKRADGGMRDAESLFDQVLSFHEEAITVDSVANFLGTVSQELFFTLDVAFKEANFAKAFEIVQEVFSQGKDIPHFVESLTEHFRTLLLLKIGGLQAPFLALSTIYHEKYQQSAKSYTQEQCLTILDFLVEALSDIRFAPSGRIALEALLLRILKVQQRIPVEFLLRQLQELEQIVGSKGSSKTHSEVQVEAPAIVKAPVAAAFSMTVDPTPSAKDLGLTASKATLPTPSPTPIPTPPPSKPPSPPPPAPNPQVPDAPPTEPRAVLTPEEQMAAIKKQSRYDTLLQFAVVELEGALQKTNNKGF